jgi:hypothetical protein
LLLIGLFKGYIRTPPIITVCMYVFVFVFILTDVNEIH